MSRVRRLGVLCSFAVAGVVFAGVGLAALAQAGGARPAPRGVSRKGALAAYGRLPLSFDQNRGQAPGNVAYVADGAGWALGLGRGGTELSLVHGQRSSSVLKVTTPGGKLGSPSAEQRLPGRVNYFLGSDRSRWVTGGPTFARIVYRDVWPGIDLAFHGRQGALEYDIDLAPGADVTRVALRFAGARGIRSDRSGGAVIRLPGGTVWVRPPRAEQGTRQVVSRLVVSGDTIRLALGSYDHARALVVDPDLVYSTYLGGPVPASGSAIAVDASGGAYVTGETGEPPTGTGGYDFVTKLNPTATALAYTTYLMHPAFRSPSCCDISDIAVDSSGNAYVTGIASPDFPTTPGAYQTSPGAQGEGCAFENGCSDAFVTKLDSAGALGYSTYLGGSGSDVGTGIAVDSAGDAYVTGTTSGSFPTTPGAFQPSNSAGAFVTKLNPAGSALVYSTYLPGGQASGIAIDSAGDAYVTGSDSVALGSFPTTPGAYQTSSSGGAFVTKLNPAGSALVYSAHLGSGEDSASGIAVDSAGDAYVTGSTSSTTFPTTPGAYQTSYRGGNSDAFVTKLNPTGSALSYSTYLGVKGDDHGSGIALDPTGDAYVTGYGNGLLPTTAGAYQTSFGGGYSDAFVTKLNASGSALLYSSYLGGRGDDDGLGIAVDSSGDAYITGWTTGFFPTTPGAYLTTTSGGNGSIPFVAKLSLGADVLWAVQTSPRTFALIGRRANGGCVKATRANRQRTRCTRPIRLRISYQLSAPARITTKLTRQLRGRLSNGRCVEPTRRNSKHRHCDRLVPLPGGLTINGKRGSNSFIFNGRIGGRKLAPGRYQLTAIPTVNGQAGTAQTIGFTIAS